MKTDYNTLLEELYLSKWEGIDDALLSFNEEDLGDEVNRATNPLLIKTGEEYQNADFKIMFFGQETNQWGSEFNEDDSDINSILAIYERFFLEKEYEQYGKPFWNFIKRMRSNESLLNTGYIWNNLLKIGKCSSGIPQNGLIECTEKYFDVIPNEIEILKPDAILFFTGPKYDQYIEKYVGEYSVSQIDGFNRNELSRLNFISMPEKLVLRTYLPSYLQRLGKEKFDQVFNSIVESLIINKKQKQTR